MPVNFFNQYIDKKWLGSATHAEKWLLEVIASEGKRAGKINIIFCSDQELLMMNREYLQHEDLTDVLTFDLSDNTDTIEGDIYISIDRIEENADKFSASNERELRRVMVHGLLHLLGYNDKTKAESKVVRQKENFYLSKVVLK